MTAKQVLEKRDRTRTFLLILSLTLPTIGALIGYFFHPSHPTINPGFWVVGGVALVGIPLIWIADTCEKNFARKYPDIAT